MRHICVSLNKEVKNNNVNNNNNFRRTSSFATLLEQLEEQQRRFQGLLRRCHQLMVEDPSLTENVSL